jgi:hypothetical protein|nr:T9SS type A sorting domain-containing protein [uncultured Psychroserpens sp.]
MKRTLLFAIALATSFTSISQTVWEPLQNIDPNTGADPYVIASGDLDGDLDIDIVIGTFRFSNDDIKWYANDGSGNFTLQPTVSTTGSLNGIGGITIADVDGINGNDIITVSYIDATVVLYANNGAGGFAAEQVIATGVTGAGQVTASDINNDGDLDISVAAFDGDEAIWFAGNGDGTFGTKQVIASIESPGNVSFADVDADGDLDALVGFQDTTTDGTIEIYYNQYIESGTMTVSWIKDAVTVDSGNLALFVVAFADVDDDGTLEVIKSDLNGGDVAYYDKVKDGASTETIISDATVIARPAVVAVADLDNDTFNDVIITDGATTSDAIIWFESTDTGGFNTEALIFDNSNQMYGITINDFDDDGDLDIAAIGYQSDTVDWFENLLETLSTDDATLETLSIFPNPAKNVLNFKGVTSEILNLEVYDILGKSVLSTSIEHNGSLDISALNSGLYIIKFENTNTTYKFVKE